MNRRQTLAALAATAALGGGWIWLNQTPGGIATLPGAAMAQGAEADPSTIEEMVQGDPDAPVELIEYASFTCPHCATFHQNQYQQLKAEYIDTGRIRFVLREVYFDRYGLWASMVARCGGPERFFGISELLFAQQRDWIGSGDDPAAIAENLRRIGRMAGLDDAQLDACLSDAEKAQSLVAWWEANAEADAINSTPTLILDGTKHQNMAYDELSALIEERLAAL